MLSCGDFEGTGFVAGLAVERFEEIRHCGAVARVRRGESCMEMDTKR